MRLEAIEKEADLYNGEGECYIHIERARNSPMKVVSAGDKAAIAQATYNMICDVASRYETTIPKMLTQFKQVYKRIGVTQKLDVNKE